MLYAEHFIIRIMNLNASLHLLPYHTKPLGSNMELKNVFSSNLQKIYLLT